MPDPYPPILPLPISIANVQKAFDPQGRVLDPAVEQMVRQVAVNLLSLYRK